MKIIISILLIGFILVSCKTSKNGKCDAYSKNEIKKDHQI